jgi:hypothetical protein
MACVASGEREKDHADDSITTIPYINTFAKAGWPILGQLAFGIKDLRELSSQEKSMAYKLKYDGQSPDQILIWRSFTPCMVYQH